MKAKVLLAHPSFLTTAAKRAWLSHRLSEAVSDDPSAVRLDLVTSRDNPLGGACAGLGVDEATGQLKEGIVAGPIHIQFSGENGVGDGVRREWFEKTVAEIMDTDRGLFCSQDGGKTLHINPHSELAAGADHLSYFALLGRIVGFAVYHQETVPAYWSTGFTKVAFGYAIDPADLDAVDPELYIKKVVYLRDRVYADRDGVSIADLDLTFEYEFNKADYTLTPGMRGAPAAIELKPGGCDIAVTEENKAEYLRLFVAHRLHGEIRRQIEAFRAGLAVFFRPKLLADLRRCCTPGDINVLLCGAVEIDLADWQANTDYKGELRAESPVVGWFWAVVQGLPAEQLAKLLQFCTGSSRAPAGGFSSLQGYNGAQHRFTLQGVSHGPDWLPTAQTCFNTLRLPNYNSKAELRAKLLTAITSSARFDEGAVAQ